MPIVMMCNKDDPGARPWGIRDDIYVRTTYKGCVLTTRERNGYHDSDFYAVVWDEDEQRVLEVEYASTRGWCIPNNAKADATEEVKVKAREWLVEWALQQWDDENKIQAKVVEPGKFVEIVKGRKYPIGTQGWVGYIVEGRWGMFVVLDTTEGERIRVSLCNLEVVNPEQYLKGPDERERFANGVRRSNAWHIPFRRPGFIVI